MKILSSEEILKFAEGLPAISLAAIQVVALVDSDGSQEKIIEILSTDELLLAQCFKQANSAAYGASKPVQTIRDMVARLGFSNIKKAAMFIAAKSLVGDPDFWFDSVSIAITSQYLARKAGMDQSSSDQVYLAGLFQNYGAYLLTVYDVKLYGPISRISDFRFRMIEENKEFGITYPAVSALVLAHYKVPSAVIDIISSQDRVYKSGFTKENVFIEIARVITEKSKKKLNVSQIREALDVDQIKSFATDSGLSFDVLDENSFAKLNDQILELAN